jgi:ribosomal protein S6
MNIEKNQKRFYTSITLINSELSKQEVEEIAQEMIVSLQEFKGVIENQSNYSNETTQKLYSISQKDTAYDIKKHKSSFFLIIVFSLDKDVKKDTIKGIIHDFKTKNNVLRQIILLGASFNMLHILSSCKSYTRANNSAW